MIFLLPLFFSLTACRKDKNQIRVAGHVYDPNTAVNVEGALVVFSAKKISSGVYNAGFEEIARTYTDAGGNFTFDSPEEYVSEYRFSVTKNGYFSSTTDISSNDVVAGEVYNAAIDFYPIGYIVLQTRNFVPHDSADFIAYSFTSGYQNCWECCDNTVRYGYGEAFQDTLTCKTRGNQNVAVTWNVTKNNLSTQHNSTLYCPAFDTVVFQINY